jgi:DnaK suppressor protein
MVSQDLSTELHEQLLAEQQRLQTEISNISNEGIRSDVFWGDENDNVDQHPADDGSELFEREKNLAIQRTLERSLDEVNQALAKFDQGTYGICESCGKPISEKRLRAMPAATLCIECKSKQEAGQRVNA